MSFFFKISNLYTEMLQKELEKMRMDVSKRHDVTQADILVDLRFFSRSYLEMQVLRLDEIDYFCFNDLRNCFCVHMLDSTSILESFFVDVLKKLHFFAFQSIDDSIRFAVECLQLINQKILHHLRKDTITKVRQSVSNN